ncbi:MAG: NUDIX domain-containing protein [Candidatus Diapherotrites archaeon]|uniref:NUDIX domain-containing protein n=1 Tax=Candidatus Iainarchaeum sp. TaxID=3101447 RepID=A0A8T3YKS7_9ARCH|nr:NUDIX domain-containing protein [Candidatus Diapherotrites archaeon]
MSAGLLDNPNQQLICVDANGIETGAVLDRRSAHSAPGTKHLAIQVLVFNKKNELVLHERPLKKVGGGVLDAPTTHVLAGETKEAAARRCLLAEYNISKKIPIKILGGYSYEKDYGDGSCENEYCLAAYCVYPGKITPAAEHAGMVFNVKASNVARELASGSLKYPVWLAETIKLVQNDSEGKKFFS